VPAFIQALLEKTADSLDQLQHSITRGEGERNAVNQNLVTLTERMSTLTDQMRAEQSVLMRLAETQGDMRTLITRLGDQGAPDGGMDETTRTHIRNLDLRLEHLLNDVASGREYAVQEIRGEIRLLTRTIAAMAEEAE
jgi:septal ring factor EnvC (AmiA/AmiB activator)